MARQLGAAALATLLVTTAAGCVNQKVQNGTTVYSYESWVAPAALLGGGASMALGWLLLSASPGAGIFCATKRSGYGMLIGAPLVVATAVPAVFMNSVKVDDYHFEVQNGWWWSPQVHKLRFDEVKEMDFSAESHLTRHGTSYTYFLECTCYSGKHESIPMDTLMDQAVDDILKRAADRGVTVPKDDDEEEDK